MEKDECKVVEVDYLEIPYKLIGNKIADKIVDKIISRDSPSKEYLKYLENNNFLNKEDDKK